MSSKPRHHSYLYRQFIEPASTDPDIRRREFILNVLLSGLGAWAMISFVSTALHQLFPTALHDTTSLVSVPIFLAIILFLFWLSKKGYSQAVSFLLVACVWSIAAYFALSWSFELPIAQLLFVLAIVLAGVLFRATAAITASVSAIAIIVLLAFMQTSGQWSTNTSWLGVKPSMADAVGVVAIFAIVGLVTWLANSEIDRLLKRARKSEASLLRERDLLEVKVKERTKELEEAHMIRLLELQRFAELGRLSASLLHDLASPLTAASLGVDALSSRYEPKLVEQVGQSLHHIQRYVEAARKQLVTGGTITSFSVKRELEQAVSILTYRANKERVELVQQAPTDLKLVGDAVKFNQLIVNLILNAIEAFDKPAAEHPRRVAVTISQDHTSVKVVVEDNAKGMDEAEQRRIFEPFYSTKKNVNRNMGLGLLLVKQYVEDEFAGTIDVQSTPGVGTIFTLHLFNKKT